MRNAGTRAFRYRRSLEPVAAVWQLWQNRGPFRESAGTAASCPAEVKLLGAAAWQLWQNLGPLRAVASWLIVDIEIAVRSGRDWAWSRQPAKTNAAYSAFMS